MSHVGNSSMMSLRQIMTLVGDEKAKFTDLEGAAGQVAGRTSDESIHASEEYKDTLEGQEDERKQQAMATMVLTSLSGAFSGASSVGIAGKTAGATASTESLTKLGSAGSLVGVVSELVLAPTVETATTIEQAVITKKMAGLQGEGSELQSATSSLGDTAGNTVDQMNQLTDVGANLAAQMRKAVGDLNEASTQPNER